MMEALMIDIGYNMTRSRECQMLAKDIWTQPFEGAFPNSYQTKDLPKFMSPLPASPSDELSPSPELIDPYNITGTWARVVCFLDFTELFHYNFAHASSGPDIPRPPLASDEATRLLMMRIEATRVEGPGEHDDGQELPVVHFTGTARPVEAPSDMTHQATLRGSVRLTRHGDVRWTTFSVYHGEERWRSEGIQLGGINSAFGVVGNWFDKDLDPHGPVGPTAFWKVSFSFSSAYLS